MGSSESQVCEAVVTSFLFLDEDGCKGEAGGEKLMGEQPLDVNDGRVMDGDMCGAPEVRGLTTTVVVES